MNATFNHRIYGWLAIGSFPVIGILNAIFLVPHWTGFGWNFLVLETLQFSLASALTWLAIGAARSKTAKVLFGLLLLFYFSFLGLTLLAAAKLLVSA